MPKTREDQIETVRRMLALERHTASNPHEAATAAAKAQHLMLRYNIEQFEIDAAQETHAQQISDGKFPHDKAERYWQGALMVKCAEVNFCKVILYADPSDGFPDGYYRVIGQWHHREAAMMLFEWIAQQMEIMRMAEEALINARHQIANRPPLNGTQLRMWKSSFNLGAVSVISERLASQFFDAEARAARSTRELILHNDQAVEEWIAKFIGKTTKRTRAPRKINREGYDAGRFRGGQVTINEKETGGKMWISEHSRI